MVHSLTPLSLSTQGAADGDDKPKKPVKAKLGVKNEFYYDEEVRRMRERAGWLGCGVQQAVAPHIPPLAPLNPHHPPTLTIS